MDAIVVKISGSEYFHLFLTSLRTYMRPKKRQSALFLHGLMVNIDGSTRVSLLWSRCVEHIKNVKFHSLRKLNKNICLAKVAFILRL